LCEGAQLALGRVAQAAMKLLLQLVRDAHGVTLRSAK
jgi:hypothetical protein